MLILGRPGLILQTFQMHDYFFSGSMVNSVDPDQPVLQIKLADLELHCTLFSKKCISVVGSTNVKLI